MIYKIFIFLSILEFGIGQNISTSSTTKMSSTTTSSTPMMNVTTPPSSYSMNDTTKLSLEPDPITSNNPEGLFEGDIILQGSEMPEVLGNGVLGERFRWKNGVVPAEIDPNFSDYERRIIYNGMKMISSKTCIRFKRRERERDYIYIRRGKSGSGCVCYGVGRQGGSQVINLAENGCIHPGVAAHEMLHAIGLHHEQTRGDRDQYIIIYYENIEPGLHHNFNKITKGTSTFGKYDYNSIMHYPNNAFSKNGKKTICARDDHNKKLGTYERLSETDAYTVNRLYGNCSV